MTTQRNADSASSQPLGLGLSEGLGPIAEVREGCLCWHIPHPTYAAAQRFRTGRHMLYDEQTLWNACARAGEIERNKLAALARRSVAQLRLWADWYGNADHAARGQLPLPPAGDVLLAEDISDALGPNVANNRLAGGKSG